MTRKHPRISVIIPAFNEAENMGACLEAFTQQTTHETFEVVVVDNNSTDRTADVVRSFGTKLHVELVHEMEKGRGMARMRGFERARGEILFSTDADTVVPPDWIESFVAALEKDPAIVAVTSTAEIADCSALQNMIFSATFPLSFHLNSMVLGHLCLSGCSFAIRREAYELAGGFNPQTDAYEDLDLASRVHKIGKIVFIWGKPVRSSGRRFKDGSIKASYDYVRTWIEKFILKKEKVPLSDVR